MKAKEIFITIMGLAVFSVVPMLADAITNTEPKTETVEAAVEAKEPTFYKTETEQKYIVRFATATDLREDGITTYVDTDGNIWLAIDAPTKIGDDARLLFDSKETFDITDDEIIDITEIK